MRLVYLTIGFISLGLGIIGIPLPILPTTPFLLLSMACFAKSSKRFETWLYQTKLYQTYVADYRETKSIAKERKKWILLQIYILMGISIFLAPIIWVKLALGALTIFITYYLLKVIPNKPENPTEENPDYNWRIQALELGKEVRSCFFFGILKSMNLLESRLPMEKLQALLSERFQIVFSDSSLLDTAFTHTSYANEHRLLKISHNERLEFLGDAVLQLVISEYLYKEHPNRPEGDLSKFRSMIVREESLAGFSRDCQFDHFIKLGKGEEKSGGRDRDTILGDLFEAFLGALLLDQGVEAVKRFIYQVMIPKVETGQFSQVIDYKTRLQELLQVHGDVEIQYQVVSESGPAHAKEFEVEVFVNGQTMGHGHGRSKKLAEQEAARNAVETRNDGPCI